MILKYIFLLLLGFNILNSNENTVKTSELELFLFKIGFESLLKDVEINKDKTTLNTQEIKVINEKIDLIMAELYKKNQTLLDDSNEEKNIQIIEKVDTNELETLKNEINLLKETIQELKKNQENLEDKQKEIKIKKDETKNIKPTNSANYIVISSKANVYKSALQTSEVLRTLTRGNSINITSCTKFGWCKIKEDSTYIKQFLIKPIKQK